jgi:hypothetical protein
LFKAKPTVILVFNSKEEKVERKESKVKKENLIIVTLLGFVVPLTFINIPYEVWRPF